MEKEINEELLKKKGGVEEEENNNGCDEIETPGQKIKNEIKKMWVVAGPAVFTRLSTYGTLLISQVFIGHISTSELAAFSVVFTVLMTFANGIMIGMASGLQTLCGQAYGAKQHHMLGIYLQRSWIVLFSTAILLLPLYIFTAPILRALGQEESLAARAGTVSLWSIPILYAYIVSYTCQVFLQAQSKNIVIAYLAVVTLTIHASLSWLLTVKYKFGLTGAMLSLILAFWIPNLGQLLFIIGGGCRETWKGFTTTALKDLWPVVKLSLSSGVMVCVEMWYNTILILLTGKLRNAEVAIDALAICLSINAWEMMISLGFLAASSVRVSNELGRGSSKAAKFSVVIAVLTSFILGFVIFIFFLLLRGKIAFIFTKSRRVATVVLDLSPLLATSILLNSIQPVLSGVAVGAGWQSIVSFVNITCYYLIGIPVGIVLGYVMNLQVKGVWVGMLFGTFVQTLALIVITCGTDWDKQVSVARANIDKWLLPKEEETESASEV